MSKNHIIVKGARQHNLQNIDVKIPRDKLVVITGLSGSGKSSLAFDTIYAEGQRRYVESLSAYARQFLGQMDKPDVDYIEGLSPAISIDQKTTSHNPRSTVGTVTEIHDYLRLLFARIGRPHCPKCGKPISKQTVDQIVDKLLLYPNGTKMQILSPLVRGRKGEYTKLFRDTKAEGYLRVSVDGEIYSLDDNIILDKQKKHNIEVVVDRLIMRDGIGKRLADSLETALAMSGGWVSILLEHIVEENDESLRNEEEKQLLKQELLSFNQNFACSECNISIEELTPRMFSFNNPYGACPTCAGLGFTIKIDPELLLPKKELSLNGGGLA
ncbi:MAG: excinuclease ABC subunit UvrA, partial [Clostridia bacterium]|nr:excinuclease ABC subunit UvrA [Clostridia bacterium]